MMHCPIQCRRRLSWVPTSILRWQVEMANKKSATQIVIRIIIAFLLMVISLWNLMGFLKEIFQNAWQGNVINSAPPSSGLWIVLGLVGVAISIHSGMAWDRIQHGEASNQRD